MTRWKEIESLIPVFKEAFQDVIDFDKFNNISITFHSTAIEGSTLTLPEAEVLIDKGLSPKGKPFIHQQMVLDHYNALIETLKLAKAKSPITVELIQSIAALVMKKTGSVIHTPLGNYDSSKGELRLNNVRAGNHYFVNYDKVGSMLLKLVAKLNQSIDNVKSIPDILTLAFTTHFDLVSIHPFADGNGRTSRLLMNFIQHYHDLPISPVFYEDRNAYIDGLTNSREQKSLEPFISFMSDQYVKYLTKEISNFQSQRQDLGKGIDKSSRSGYSLVF